MPFECAVGSVESASGTGILPGPRLVSDGRHRQCAPYLFSNSVATPVVAASIRALDLIESSHELRDPLRENTRHFRASMTDLSGSTSSPESTHRAGDDRRRSRGRHILRAARRPRGLRRQLLLPRRRPASAPSVRRTYHQRPGHRMALCLAVRFERRLVPAMRAARGVARSPALIRSERRTAK